MSSYAALLEKLSSSQAAGQLDRMYGSGSARLQAERYAALVKRHQADYQADGDVLLVSAPGRTEIGGNHTDHNKGKVLAAAVNLDTASAVSARKDMLVHVDSEGFPPLALDLSDLTAVKAEEGTTAALIRGVSARMKELGYRVGGFDMTATSTVAAGSGLSSSAAFEVLITAVQDALYNGFRMDFKTRAQVGQYAENVYFGKPSGLLDQMASAAGGLVTVDFKDPDPDVRAMKYDFSARGYSLVVVATGGSHADLTDDYAAIPAEMKAVAAHFGQPYLRCVPYADFLKEIPALRKEVSDRALLRAIHFYNENDRVDQQVAALEQDKLPDFFRAIIASGRSSFMYLQNVYARPTDQSLSLALALAENALAGKGAWRIHGGGFAGTTLNFVPQEQLDSFIAMMEGAFGKGCCHALNIRPEGAWVLELE